MISTSIDLVKNKLTLFNFSNKYMGTANGSASKIERGDIFTDPFYVCFN